MGEGAGREHPRIWEGFGEGRKTLELLRLQADGRTPELRTAEDERMHEAWLGAARLAIATGLLTVPETARTA